nr:MAG TPA: hypothetical protein [Caudoviricetes sp.]
MQKIQSTKKVNLLKKRMATYPKCSQQNYLGSPPQLRGKRHTLMNDNSIVF